MRWVTSLGCDATLGNASPQMDDSFTSSTMNLLNRYASSQMIGWVTGPMMTALRPKPAERLVQTKEIGNMMSMKMLVHRVGSARAMACQRPHEPVRASSVAKYSLKKSRHI